MAQSEKPDVEQLPDDTDDTLNSNEPERIPFSGMVVGTDISMELPTDRIRVKSRLIGIESDQFLIISLPLAPAIMHKCKPDSEVIVRYLFNGSVMGFASVIIQVFSNPVGVCFLKFPNSVEQVNLRKDKRVRCFFPGIAEYQGIEVEGAILDLSAGGCRFFMEESLHSGGAEIRSSEKISLHIEPFGSLEGQVANVTNLPEIFSLGIAFTKVSPEFKKRVRAMLKMASKFQPFHI